MKHLTFICAFLFATGVFTGCGSDDEYTPKPRAYFRIDLPKKAYTAFSSTDCPYTFEYPVYAEVQRDTNFMGAATSDPCWLNIDMKGLSAIIHVSYKEISRENNLPKLIEDAHKLSYKHTVKADYIDETPIHTPNNVQGLVYEIGGNAASNIQFYLTDSTKHFIRGALYFNTPPNSDSLAPVVKFVKEDMVHMIDTWKWQ